MAGTMSLNQLSGFQKGASGYPHHRLSVTRADHQKAGSTRRRNLLLFGLVWTIGMLTLLWVWNGGADAGTKSTTMRVTSGDTLWKIAREVSPQQDPRVVSNEIIHLNHLTGSEQIYPGEVLKVPAH